MCAGPQTGSHLLYLPGWRDIHDVLLDELAAAAESEAPKQCEGSQLWDYAQGAVPRPCQQMGAPLGSSSYSEDVTVLKWSLFSKNCTQNIKEQICILGVDCCKLLYG